MRVGYIHDTSNTMKEYSTNFGTGHNGAQRGRLPVLILTENKFCNASRSVAHLQASVGESKICK